MARRMCSGSRFAVREVLSGKTWLLCVLLATFVFSLGSAAWSAVVAGHLAQSGLGTARLGTLYAVCDLLRIPAAIILPAITLHYGARRVTQAGLALLVALPLFAGFGLGTTQLMALFVGSALPTMAVYVGLPAFVIGATRSGRDGWSLAWMGLVGGAGGAFGPWVGGMLSDTWGALPALLLFALGGLLLAPISVRGHLPPPSPWPGWTSLAAKGLPWQALAALALASAADAGRAALVPTTLVRDGMSLTDAGLFLGAGCALAGTGFLLFGRLADRHPPKRVLATGLTVLVLGSFASAWLTSWALAYAVSSAFLGLGASGMRLGAEIALITWLGRDRAGVAAALSETTIAGGRAFGAPTVGALGDAHGGAFALNTIGLTGVLAGLALAVLTSGGMRWPRLGALPARLTALEAHLPRGRHRADVSAGV